MKLLHEESISLVGIGARNEDRLFHNTVGAGVIDGATGLSSEKHFEGLTDAAWFSEQLKETLSELVKRDGPLLADLSDAIDRINQNARELGVSFKEIPKFKHPSATIALTKMRNGQLEYLVLGDCTIALMDPQVKPNVIHIWTDSRLNSLDQRVIDFIYDQQRSNGLTWHEARELALPMLRRHREMMNKPDGYFNVSMDKLGLTHALTGAVSVGKDTQIVMATDGYSCAMDLFGVSTWRSLVLGDKTIRETLYALRSLEQQDPECFQVPRLKTADDATAIRLKVVND